MAFAHQNELAVLIAKDTSPRTTWRDVPIIFVTAFAEERLQKRALAAGAVGFLSKPFDLQTLITLVEEALKTRREA